MDWRQQAACKGDVDRFFSRDAVDLARARRMCAGCPVRDECFEYAMSHPNLQGVWAGLTPRERRELGWGRVA
ncbi:MAG TPA: WhiB family transcriptional regulator [Acidimicrobiales bacterium]|nr:WhiB family transcriptional regulator [Acidimicrobiales bacterium]